MKSKREMFNKAWHIMPMADPNPKTLAVGRRIAQARKAKDIGQRELADLIGVTSGAVAAYEVGRNLPRLHQMDRLASALDVTTAWLLTGDDPDELARAQTKNELGALDLFRSLPADQQDAALAMLAGLSKRAVPV